MDDGWVLQVQVVEAGQDLPRPLAHRLQLQVAVLLPVLPQIPRREELCDEVDAVMLRVMPTPAATVPASELRSADSCSTPVSRLCPCYLGFPIAAVPAALISLLQLSLPMFERIWNPPWQLIACPLLLGWEGRRDVCMQELSLLDKRPFDDRRVTRQLVLQATPPCTLLPAPTAKGRAACCLKCLDG